MNKENLSNRILTTPKLATNKIAKAGFNATKAYLSMGAKMAEGDFSKPHYKSNNRNNVNARKSNFQNTEYMNKIANNNEMKKLGDENEPKGYS